MKLALVALMLGACADELRSVEDANVTDPGDDAQVSGDAALDAGEPDANARLDAQASVDAASDARIDAGPDSSAVTPERCSKEANQQLTDFVEQHRSCSADDDCVIVGDCSHSDFRAVVRSAAEEATRLVQNICSADGPGANAICRAGKCEAIRSVDWCGQAPRTECAANLTRRQPGCDPVTLPKAGCYADCSAVGNNAACAPGYTCQETSINPCVGQTCDACGQLVTLCLPAPACELELGLDVRTQVGVAKLQRNESTYLRLTLTNRTDRVLQLGFDIPCHGPAVTGLGSYDVWGTCLAGACAQPTQHVTLTLKPRETLDWRKALLVAGASTCNAQGLPAGSYAPSFSLANLTGAVSCGPVPTSLAVAP